MAAALSGPMQGDVTVHHFRGLLGTLGWGWLHPRYVFVASIPLRKEVNPFLNVNCGADCGSRPGWLMLSSTDGFLRLCLGKLTDRLDSQSNTSLRASSSIVSTEYCVAFVHQSVVCSSRAPCCNTQRFLVLEHGVLLVYASEDDWAEHQEPLDDVSLSALSTVETTEEGGEVSVSVGQQR